MQRFSSLLWIVLSLIANGSRADDSDVIRQKIDRDKKDYSAAVADAKTKVMEALDNQIAAARRQGKLSKVEQIKEEKALFDTEGALPRSVPTTEYSRQIRQAQKTIDAALDSAIKAYVKLSKDEEAKALDVERSQLRASGALSKPADKTEIAPRANSASRGEFAEAPQTKNRTGAIDLSNFTPASVRLVSYPSASEPFAVLGGGVATKYVPSNPAMKGVVAKEDTGYRIVPGGVKVGAMTYGDRTVRLTKVDPAFVGLTLLQTRQGQKGIVDSRFAIVLESPQPCVVFLALDQRAEQTYAQHGRPAWLEGFAPTGRTVASDDPGMTRAGASYSVLARRVPKGELMLGPPGLSVEGNAMYFAFFGEEKE